MKTLISGLLGLTVVGMSFIAQAETLGNQPQRWLIDDAGIPKYNLEPAVSGWFARPLPDAQSAVAISADYYHYRGPKAPDNGFEYSAFAISNNGNAFRYINNDWHRVAGCWGAKDITSYNVDKAYCVNGDGSISQYDSAQNNFVYLTQIEGKQVKKVDVSSDNVLWAVTENADLYQYDQSTWTQVHQGGDNHLYTDDVASSEGQIYVINYHYQVGAPAIYKVNGQGFDLIASGFNLVDVDRTGAIWARATFNHELMVSWPHTDKFNAIRSYPHWRFGLTDIGM